MRDGVGMAAVNTKPSGMMISQSESGVPLTQENIDRYLEYLRSAGRVQGIIDSYRRKIGRLYQALPKDEKAIRRDTLLWWREKLAEEGCSPTGINQFIIVVNGYLEYMGARELQMVDRLKSPGEFQPELSRNEYLRLLSAARSLGREQAYLLVKVFGNSDLLVQELKNLTVEAARTGMLSIRCNYCKKIVRFPKSICRELLDCVGRVGIRSGPIFLTRNGKAIDRTYVAQSIKRRALRPRSRWRRGTPAVCGNCTRPPGRALSATWPCWWSRPRTGCWRRNSSPSAGTNDGGNV